MQYERLNKKYHGRMDDLLFDYFKDNLEDLQLPANDECWENILQQINSRKRKRLLPFLCSVAAILLLIILLGIKYQLSDNSILQRMKIASNKNFVFAELKHGHESSEPIQSRNNSNQYYLNQMNSGMSSSKSEACDDGIPMIGLEKIRDSDRVDENYPVFPDSGKQDISERKTARTEERSFLLDEYNGEIFFPEVVCKSKDQWELAAAWGLSGSSSGFLDKNIYTSAMGEDPDLLIPDNLSEVEYTPPFSVGFSIRKRVNNILSLETGLMYSYLSTDYKNNNESFRAENLKLHYLGIPLNAVVDIWNVNSEFKIYTSGGVTLEKGIRYTQSRNISEIAQSPEFGRIDGVQWSLNGSLGASYTLFKNWSIYLEPRLSYYFDNDQPLSIRTEKQTIFSINSGIRYEF